MMLTRPGNKNILAVLVLIGFMQADADLHLEMIFLGWSSLTGEQSFTNKIRRFHPDGLNLNLLPTKVTSVLAAHWSSSGKVADMDIFANEQMRILVTSLDRWIELILQN